MILISGQLSSPTVGPACRASHSIMQFRQSKRRSKTAEISFGDWNVNGRLCSSLCSGQLSSYDGYWGLLNGIIYITLTSLNPTEISRVILIGFYQSIILC